MGLNRFSHLLWLQPTFLFPAIIAFMLLAVSLLDPQGLTRTIHIWNQWLSHAWGDGYLWFGMLTLAAFILLAVLPVGGIRLGGPGERPTHSFFSWCAMLFCTGMGVGFMFWGAAEPLYHFVHPPLSGTHGAVQRELVAMAYTFFHWGLHPWSIYGMTAVAIGFLGFNLNRPFRFSSFLSVSQSSSGLGVLLLKNVIDVMTVLAVIVGIAATFAMGVLHVEGGIRTLLPWTVSGHFLELLIVATILIVYMLSILRGLEKGIKVLSHISVWLSFALLAGLVVFMFDPRWLPSLINAASLYVTELPMMGLGMGDYRSPDWVGLWTVKYWSWWIAWAPFVGLFIALISRGRTVREVVLGVMVVPTLFSIIWFFVFGHSAIQLQSVSHLFGAHVEFSNINTILFVLLNHISRHSFLSWLSLALVIIFISNSVDSATYTMAQWTHAQMIQKPDTGIQIAWGLLFAVLTMGLLLAGGIDLLQEITLITTLPFTVLLFCIFVDVLIRMMRYPRSVT